MSCKSVILLSAWCLCYANSELLQVDGKSNGYPREPLGNIMDFSWKLPEDGGGGDSQCSQDIRRMYNSLNNMTLWAFQMWEATAGETNGWIEGSKFQLGNFDECLGGDDPGMERQYCLATVNITQHPNHPPIHNYVEKFGPYQSVYDVMYYTGDLVFTKRTQLHWGICSPASCSNTELEILLQNHIDRELMKKANNGTDLASLPRISITLPEKLCQRSGETKSFGVGAIIFCLIMGLSSFAVIVTSLVHWYMLFKNPDIKPDEIPNIVKAFSLITQLKGLTYGAMGGNKKGVDVLWGMRVVSICFFILTHRIGTRLAGPTLNRTAIEKQYHSPIFSLIYHGDLLVDSFLVFSGILSYVVNMKVLERSTKLYPLLIIYRYMRMAPLYAIVIMFTGHILPLTGSGPLWPTEIETEGAYCRENWWINILMLSNYINVDRMCMVHSWYMACDFHMFLVTLPVSLLFNNKSRVRIGLVVLGVLTFVSMLIPAIITFVGRLPGTMLFTDEFLANPRAHTFFQNIFIATHTRAGPYFIGFLAGYILYTYHKPGNKLMTAKVTSIVGALSMVVLVGLMFTGAIFYQPNHQYSAIEAALYAGFQRSLWATALSVLIMCCIFGNFPIITTTLGWPAWVPLGKLTLGAYLIHMGLQIRSTTTSRNPYYVDNITLIGQAFGDIFISFALSLLTYVTIEVPVRKLFTMFMSQVTGITIQRNPETDYQSPAEKSDNTNGTVDVEMSGVTATPEDGKISDNNSHNTKNNYETNIKIANDNNVQLNIKTI